MIAYQNNINLKKLCLAKLKIAKKENKLIQGSDLDWNWNEGSPVGCIVQHENRSVELFSKKFGFPQELVDLEEYIFSNINNDLAYEWVMGFFGNIEVGQDTNKKWQQIKRKILTDSQHGILNGISQRIPCTVSKNIISYISDNVYQTKMEILIGLMESTLNPLVNDAISHDVFQDIIDIVDMIKEDHQNIVWILNKANFNDLVKITNKEIVLQY